MKNLYLCVVLILGPAICLAQKQNVYFLKNTGQYVSKLDSADYIRVVREPDAGSALYNVFDFYPKGQEKMAAKSSTVDPVKLQGQSVSYFINTRQKQRAEYKNNVKTGNEYNYYPNGQLYYIKHYSDPDSLDTDKKKTPQTTVIITSNDSTGNSLVNNGNGHFILYDDSFTKITEEGDLKNGYPDGEWKGTNTDAKLSYTEVYDNGKLLNGKATTITGLITTYKSRTEQPRYNSGINDFYKFLGQNIRYPSTDRENNVQGTVVVKFVVESNGGLGNIQVFRSVSATIDAEAVRVVKLSANGWKPGTYFGRPASIYFTVPISFSLKR